VTLTTAISAPAQIVNGDASMGQQLAQKWCNDCHPVGAEDAEAYGSVPSFVLIAEMCSSIGGLAPF
jgi:mono/diheme cytochrome c family protein